MEVSGILHNLTVFLPGKKPVHIEYKVVSSQSWSEYFDEEKNFAPTRIQTPVHPFHSLSIIPYGCAINIETICQQTTQQRDIMYKST